MTVVELVTKEEELWEELQLLNSKASRKRAEWLLAKCDLDDARLEAETKTNERPPVS
jgi:hypothetical protein